VKSLTRILADITCGKISYAGFVTLFAISLLSMGTISKNIGKKVQIIHAL
jgi:hypothetical protein